MYTLPTIFLPFICTLLSLSPAQASAPAPVPSPSAHTDLICHTSHASECYPSIFQPTERFQRIHDDQSIPPGLHVRMNLATGLKEARLNVPGPDDAPKADLVIIDNGPALAIDEQEPLGLGSGNHDHAEDFTRPEYGDDVEGNLPNIPYVETDEFEYYRQNAVTLFDTNPNTPNRGEVLPAIVALTEFAHDLEWGSAITRDATLVRIFVDLVNPSSTSPIEVQSAAVQLLGTAIQNNPEALEALLAQSTAITPLEAVHAALISSARESISENMMILQKRLVFLLSQLCHDMPQAQLQEFVSSDGLTTLLEIFDAECVVQNDGRDKIRTKIAYVMLDQVLPAINGWPGNSLHTTLPANVTTELLESQRVWISVVKGMGPWCQAFKTILDVYDVGADPSYESVKAHGSVSEAYQMLDQVLSAQGYAGGCSCHLEGTCASVET